MAGEGRSIILFPGEGIATAIPGLSAVFKVVSRDTGGSHTVIETTITPGAATLPRHRHRSMDEEFYILDGELTMTVGPQTFAATRGMYIYVSRGVPHTVANHSDSPVTFLDTIHPAGFERFYRELATAYATAGGAPDEETIAALFANYDTEIA